MSATYILVIKVEIYIYKIWNPVSLKWFVHLIQIYFPRYATFFIYQ